MSKLFSSLTYYQLIGWVGFVATVSMFGSLFADWAVILGWLTIFSTTIFFYTTTIEAEYVECEWASFITIPSGLVMIFASFEPINYFIAVVGPLALIYALVEQYAPRYPKLAQLLHTEERRARAAAKRATRLEEIRQERQASASNIWNEPELPEQPPTPKREEQLLP